MKFTNEDLLQVFLKVVEKYPGIRFVGAHQLHIGWERLSELLDRFENLFIDTSVGCVLKEDLLIHEHDRDYIRRFFIKYSNRIMYGTDLFVTDTSNKFFSNTDDALSNVSKPHINFIRKLILPHNELQRISYKNAEQLFDII